jgi:hypothetical protein
MHYLTPKYLFLNFFVKSRLSRDPEFFEPPTQEIIKITKFRIFQACKIWPFFSKSEPHTKRWFIAINEWNFSVIWVDKSSVVYRKHATILVYAKKKLGPRRSAILSASQIDPSVLQSADKSGGERFGSQFDIFFKPVTPGDSSKSLRGAHATS